MKANSSELISTQFLATLILMARTKIVARVIKIRNTLWISIFVISMQLRAVD